MVVVWGRAASQARLVRAATAVALTPAGQQDGRHQGGQRDTEQFDLAERHHTAPGQGQGESREQHQSANHGFLERSLAQTPDSDQLALHGRGEQHDAR